MRTSRGDLTAFMVQADRTPEDASQLDRPEPRVAREELGPTELGEGPGQRTLLGAFLGLGVMGGPMAGHLALAGFIDAGWDGHITLELSNVASLPITLYPGMKIGQISFLRMTTAADSPYGSAAAGSKYQGQRGPTPSRYSENFRIPGYAFCVHVAPFQGAM